VETRVVSEMSEFYDDDVTQFNLILQNLKKIKSMAYGVHFYIILLCLRIGCCGNIWSLKGGSVGRLEETA
jgi:hypothetical protein